MIMDRVGVGPRTLAYLIDIALFIVVSCCLGAVVALASGGDFEATGGPAFLVNCLVSLAALAYWVVLEGNSGQTLGKRVVKIKVVREDGSPITMGEALIRNLLRIVDFLPFLYILGIILISTSPTKQRLGDRVAKTIVVGVGPTNQEAPPMQDPPLPRF